VGNLTKELNKTKQAHEKALNSVNISKRA